MICCYRRRSKVKTEKISAKRNSVSIKQRIFDVDLRQPEQAAVQLSGDIIRISYKDQVYTLTHEAFEAVLMASQTINIELDDYRDKFCRWVDVHETDANFPEILIKQLWHRGMFLDSKSSLEIKNNDSLHLIMPMIQKLNQLCAFYCSYLTKTTVPFHLAISMKHFFLMPLERIVDNISQTISGIKALSSELDHIYEVSSWYQIMSANRNLRSRVDKFAAELNGDMSIINHCIENYKKILEELTERKSSRRSKQQPLIKELETMLDTCHKRTSKLDYQRDDQINYLDLTQVLEELHGANVLSLMNG